MVKKTNFVKLYKIMYKLTAIKYRHSLGSMVKNINQYDDRQVFELMHAVNTNVDITKLANPKLSSAEMRQIRLNSEFSKSLNNIQFQNTDDKSNISLLR